MNNIKEFPRKYLNKWWLKNAKPFEYALTRIIGESGSSLQSEVLNLYEIFESTVDRLVHDMDKLKIYKVQMKELLTKVETEIPSVPKMNPKDVLTSTPGVKESKKIKIRSGILHQSVTKGSGIHSSWNSRV
ncbi:hypothetical protein CTI12_AA277850 [Artemisia annua]|uniref:Uncharacterized protein n=1 Tax=Artemisia annua TaxID=35608 RepID=A0A2U1NE17_ARTAN|nr:hypothetical protein CTI12_AA277850 [Artemisia annua]